MTGARMRDEFERRMRDELEAAERERLARREAGLRELLTRLIPPCSPECLACARERERRERMRDGSPARTPPLTLESLGITREAFAIGIARSMNWRPPDPVRLRTDTDAGARFDASASDYSHVPDRSQADPQPPDWAVPLQPGQRVPRGET